MKLEKTIEKVGFYVMFAASVIIVTKSAVKATVKSVEYLRKVTPTLKRKFEKLEKKVRAAAA